MATDRIVLRARRIVLPTGEQSGSVLVEDGQIAAIGVIDADVGAAQEVRLAEDEVLLPGLVDAHVHVNEPGRTEWEGYATATKAAAAGGVTTLIDMPLNSKPSTTSVANLEIKRQAAVGKLMIDVGFWGGVLPGTNPEVAPLWDEGVFGFKCFLGDSGLAEYPYLSPEQLTEAMRAIAAVDGLLIVHAEDAETLNQAPPAAGPSFEVFMNSHPKKAEDIAIANVIAAMRQTGCRVHILHLASADSLPAIQAAKQEGLPLSVETCPHYLTFDAEEIPDAATQYKCCPPLRDHANRMALWAGLLAGTIDFVASDHSPCTADLKCLETGDFGAAWGGIASVQLSLPAVWTEGRKLGASLADVARWLGSAPVGIIGLSGKGKIEVGNQADFAIFAPDQSFTVDKDALFHKNPVSPYHGRMLQGVVRQTWLAGQPIDLDGPRRGQQLRRS